jgi:hypothetical protein
MVILLHKYNNSISVIKFISVEMERGITVRYRQAIPAARTLSIFLCWQSGVLSTNYWEGHFNHAKNSPEGDFLWRGADGGPASCLDPLAAHEFPPPVPRALDALHSPVYFCLIACCSLHLVLPPLAARRRSSLAPPLAAAPARARASAPRRARRNSHWDGSGATGYCMHPC